MRIDPDRHRAAIHALALPVALAPPAALVLPVALAIALLLTTSTLTARAAGERSADGIWTVTASAHDAELKLGPNSSAQMPESYGVFAVDHRALEQLLDTAPMEGVVAVPDSPAIFTLPMPDGSYARYRIVESPFLGSEVQELLPDYRSWMGQGVDDPTATIRFDLSKHGFHAYGRSEAGTISINPWERDRTDHVVSAWKRDRSPLSGDFECLTANKQAQADDKPGDGVSSGTDLHKYRLVVTGTEEYFCYFDPNWCFLGGINTADALAAIATTVNNVNAIFEVDVAIRFELVHILYWYPSDDPFVDGTNINQALVDMNQALVDSLWGSANYDLGHVFSAEAAQGWAPGEACDDATKAKSGTALHPPEGHEFDVDFVSHELGHTFYAGHTMDGTQEFCDGAQWEGWRVEPGSGSTVMSYSGSCEGENVQDLSDPYFHVINLEDITTYRDLFGTCAVTVPTGNTPPVVDAGPDATIPRGTPFFMFGSATDADGDALTYVWEQYDNGEPLFRSVSPTTGGDWRYLPDGFQVLSGASDPFEVMPPTDRTMHFRLTARDNRAGGGGVADDQAIVTVSGDPFFLTYPNGGETFTACQPLTVSWNPGGGDASVAPFVEIHMYHGGNFTLVEAVPNTGSAEFEMPTGITATDCRLFLVANTGSQYGAHFYDASDADFTLTDGTADYEPYLLTGWGDRIVVRPVPDASPASAPLPPTLTGGSTCYVSWAYWNAGTAHGCGSFENVAYLDERTVATLTDPPDGGGGGSPMNHPMSMRGGRHTAWQVSDPNDNIVETDETNNGYARQWVWTAPPLFWEFSTPPPHKDAGSSFIPAGTTFYENVDGFRVPVANAPLRVVGLSNEEPAADYDLHMYTPSEGVEDGFEIPLVSSSLGVGMTDAILINSRIVTTTAYEVGVLNYNEETSGYRMEYQESDPPLSIGGASIGETFGFYDMTWVGEFYVGPGELGNVTVELLNVSANQPVTLALFDTGLSYAGLQDAMATTAVDGDGRASLTTSIAASGYYGILVYRHAKDGVENFSFEVKVRDPSLVTPFTDVSAGLAPLRYSAAAWGDYDADGDLDVAIAGLDSMGQRTSLIYRNDGGSFSDIGAGLVGVSAGALAWADYDKDGDLDLALTGFGPTQQVSSIYRNDAGVFTDIGAGLEPIQDSAVAWGDYDNDGDPDIVISGRDNSFSDFTQIYRNDAGVFTDIGAGILGITSGALKWVDYDIDGDLDVVMTRSYASGGHFTSFYRNDSGVFVNTFETLPSLRNGAADWGDYDSDGDLDIAMSGQDGSFNPIALVYRKTVTSYDIPANMDGHHDGAVAWGDYDNDGDPDILLTGLDSGDQPLSQLYFNDAGSFVDAGPGLLGVQTGPHGGIWGDYDGDGDLDILLTGTDDGAGPVSIVYRNDVLVANTPPNPPTNLRIVWNGSVATFEWDAATDAETPAGGLSYNLRIGSTPGSDDIYASMADAATGFRRVVGLGNASQNLSWSVDMDGLNSFHWSVQAVDAAFAGSAFAPEYYYFVEGFVDIASGIEGVSSSSVAWGDYDDDGDLDILLTGLTTTDARISRVYRNDAGAFVDIGAPLTGVSSGHSVWGDYDNDGDLDILHTGLNGVRIAQVYRNDAGTFVDIGAGLEGVSESSVAWGDYDNDGDLDILLTGRAQSLAAVAKLYRNDAGVFTDIGAGLEGVHNSSVAWGDHDTDGDLDILLTGQNGSGVRVSRIYGNNAGSFADIGAGLDGVSHSSVAWGDYDDNGDPDILLTGLNGFDEQVAAVYQNESGSFVVLGEDMEGVFDGSAAWGDRNNDGHVDVLLTGRTAIDERIAHIYDNDTATFSEIGAGLEGVDASSAAWGDFDNDGDLDVLLSGMDGGAAPTTRIYRNDMGNPNTPPSAPTNLSAHIANDVARFSWNSANDSETLSEGLTYNLRIGTTPGGDEVCSAMALASGLRKIPALGNAHQQLSWSMDATAYLGQTLYWSVQSVDGAFAGSPFAGEETLILRATAAPALPTRLALLQNHPNPFNPSTTIRFELPKASPVRVTIYDVSGRTVRTLVRDNRGAGRHEVTWRGLDDQGLQVGSGVYLYRLQAGELVQTRRMTLLK